MNNSEDMWNMVIGCIITSHLDHKRRTELMDFVRKAEEKLNSYRELSAFEDNVDDLGGEI